MLKLNWMKLLHEYVINILCSVNMSIKCSYSVAERNLNFCLARNLIWPLELPNIFTLSGWLVLFSPNHISQLHQKLKKARKSLSLSFRNPQRERTSIRLFLNSSSTIIHYEKSHLVYGSLGFILRDQGILVKKKKRLDDTL